MRTMVRAAQESKVRKGIGPDSGIGTGIAENLKGNGKVGIRNQGPTGNRVLKWWNHKNQICKILRFVKIFWKNNL